MWLSEDYASATMLPRTKEGAMKKKKMKLMMER